MTLNYTYSILTENDDLISNRLIDNARLYPEKTAFIWHSDTVAEKIITNKELLTRVKQLAVEFTNCSLRGKTALLVYEDVLEFIFSFLACQFAGVIAVPAAYGRGSRQNQRLIEIIEDGGIISILTTTDLSAVLKKGMKSYINDHNIDILTTEIIGFSQDSKSMLPYAHTETAFIQYTSGSTSKPKGVVITGRNLMHNQRLINEVFKCNTASVILSWLPFNHDMGLIGNILHSIFIGCKCILMSPLHFIQRPLKWLELITLYQVTHSGGPNFAYDLCVDKISDEELPTLNLSSWTVAYNGAEPVRKETIDNFSDRFKQAGFLKTSFYPCYGLAESTLLVSGAKEGNEPQTLFVKQMPESDGNVVLTADYTSSSNALVSCGKVASDIELRIFSSHTGWSDNELEQGEICISGESITKGYWRKQNDDLFYELQGKKFLRTGDTGFLYQDNLYVCGRIKEMIIIRGINYYPQDIEWSLSECHPAIQKNGLASFALQGTEDNVVIVVEIKRAFIDYADPLNIIHTVYHTLANTLGISCFDIILVKPYSIPRTTSGKLKRLQCLELYENKEFDTLATLITAVKAGPVENDGQKLINDSSYDIIRTYLIQLIKNKVKYQGVVSITDSTNLTEIGMDSLRAMELINAINKDFGIHIDPVTIFQNNTISELAGLIENMVWLNNNEKFGKDIII